jgi:tetratricopeptide (TPR) repeat protein
LAQSKLEKAKPLWVGVLERRKKQDPDEQHLETLVARGNLATLYLCEGNWQAAEQSYSSLLPIMKRQLGKFHDKTLAIARDLAKVYEHQGRYWEARELLEELLDIWCEREGSEQP